MTTPLPGIPVIAVDDLPPRHQITWADVDPAVPLRPHQDILARLGTRCYPAQVLMRDPEQRSIWYVVLNDPYRP